MFNTIRSKYILKAIFNYLKKRISLKISKYNKHLQNKLNIGIKDFQNFSDLKEMNVIYHTNIKDTDIKCLKLINKKINDDKLEILSKIEFNNLKELNLSENLISDISLLEKVNLNNLTFLKINYNEISDISKLKKVKFEKIKELHFYYWI